MNPQVYLDFGSRSFGQDLGHLQKLCIIMIQFIYFEVQYSLVQSSQNYWSVGKNELRKWCLLTLYALVFLQQQLNKRNLETTNNLHLHYHFVWNFISLMSSL